MQRTSMRTTLHLAMRRTRVMSLQLRRLVVCLQRVQTTAIMGYAYRVALPRSMQP